MNKKSDFKPYGYVSEFKYNNINYKIIYKRWWNDKSMICQFILLENKKIKLNRLGFDNFMNAVYKKYPDVSRKILDRVMRV